MRASAHSLGSSSLVRLACVLLLLFAAALAFRSGDQLRWPDETIYVNIAKGLAHGKGFLNDKGEASAFRPPGYPFAVSLVFRLAESVLFAKLLGVAAITVTTWLLAQMVRLLTPQTQALAPCLVLCYPVLAYTSSTLTPQNLGSLFFIAGLLLLFQYPARLAAAAAAGLLFGALILIIPAFALVLGCLGVVLLVARVKVRTHSLRYLLVLHLVMAGVVSPWIVRSSFLFNEFVFISTNSGVNFLFGNSPNATTNSGVVDITEFEPKIALSEVALDRHYKQAATQWIQTNPTKALKLYAGKVVNYFNFRNDISTTTESSNAISILMFLTYYPLLVLALVRAVMFRRYRFSWPEMLLYVIYFGNSFLSAIVYSRIRYRLPFDFLLIAIVSIFVGRILQARSERNGHLATAHLLQGSA